MVGNAQVDHCRDCCAIILGNARVMTRFQTSESLIKHRSEVISSVMAYDMPYDLAVARTCK